MRKSAKGRLIWPIECDEKIRDGYVFLDTNILLNVGLGKSAYIEIFERFDELNVTRMTIDMCLWEFLRGTKDGERLKIKRSFLKTAKLTIEPIKYLEKFFMQLNKAYREVAKKISLTDLFLASVLVKYRKHKNVFILTGDYHDFLFNFFKREAIIVVDEGKEIKPLVLLRLNEESFDRSVVKF